MFALLWLKSVEYAAAAFLEELEVLQEVGSEFHQLWSWYKLEIANDR